MSADICLTEDQLAAVIVLSFLGGMFISWIVRLTYDTRRKDGDEK